MDFRGTAQKQSFKQSLPNCQFEKVTVQKSIAELWPVISDQMIKYQLAHARFDQISDHKHDIYLYGKLSAELLVQAATNDTKFMFTKTGHLLFSY